MGLDAYGVAAGAVDLQVQEGFIVPRGVLHRTGALDRAVILMVENAGIVSHWR
jgi:hypothetical protein